MRGLGPMPRAPRKFHRDFDLHGHHRDCDHTIADAEDRWPLACTCRELDEDDYAAACEARYDAWKSGDYADNEPEVRDDD